MKPYYMRGPRLLLRILCRLSPRFHLRAICHAIGIKPYVWQRAFALGRISSLPGKRTRGNGKTTAVMLRLLMLPPGSSREAERILNQDPDFLLGANRYRMICYGREYRRLQLACILERVPVSDLDTTFFKGFY